MERAAGHNKPWIFPSRPSSRRSAAPSRKSARALATTIGSPRIARAASRTTFIAPSPTTAGSASAIPQAYGGSGLGVTEAALMMQTIAQSGAGLSGASALHMNIFGLNPVVDVRQRRTEEAHVAALDRRRRQGLFRGHRAGRRPRHAEPEDQGGARGRALSAVRPEDLDLDRAGGEQDADPGAHHAARSTSKSERKA